MKAMFLVMVAVIAAGGLGWYLGKQGKDVPSQSASGDRKIAFYQSSMHPWIKSDKPGTCTICGMKLTPIYEGEQGFALHGDVVTLSSNSVQAIGVQSEPVKTRAIERFLLFAGRIEADETRVRVLSAYVDGRVDKLFVNYVGAEVKAGSPLAVLYSPTLLAAEREYLNIANLTNHAVSPQLATEQQKLAEGAYHRLRRLGLTDADIEKVRASGGTNLATSIVAPISGTILSRAVFEGQYVKEGDKLFEIADLSKLWFRFDVYEQDLPWIHSGESLQISSPALGTNIITGIISFIDPTIDQTSRSARVRIEVENPLIGEGDKARRRLYNGIFAEARLVLKSATVLAVPRTAVLDPGDFTRIYVDQGAGAYELRRVKIGLRGERYWEVLEGVDEDELVVTSGNFLLDGQSQIDHHSASPSIESHGVTEPEGGKHE